MAEDVGKAIAERERVEDDRIFIGAAVLLAQVVGPKLDAADRESLQPAIANAVSVAYWLNDAVETRRANLRADR
jgi:hypothetical protein